jgi:hypothetical protein
MYLQQCPEHVHKPEISSRNLGNVTFNIIIGGVTRKLTIAPHNTPSKGPVHRDVIRPPGQRMTLRNATQPRESASLKEKRYNYRSKLTE